MYGHLTSAFYPRACHQHDHDSGSEHHDEHEHPPDHHSTEGRYVIIAAQKAGVCLNIADLEVYDENGEDVARHGHVTQSCYYEEHKFPPTNLNDGNVNTFAQTSCGNGGTPAHFEFPHTTTSIQPGHDYSVSNQWMLLDLGSDMSITSVVIQNRRDCCQDKLGNGVKLLIFASHQLEHPTFESDTLTAAMTQTLADDMSMYEAGHTFLDQNNAHGDVITAPGGKPYDSGFEATPLGCRHACDANPECGGVTYNPDKHTCYLNKPGNYLESGLASDHAWVKKAVWRSELIPCTTSTCLSTAHNSNEGTMAFKKGYVRMDGEGNVVVRIKGLTEHGGHHEEHQGEHHDEHGDHPPAHPGDHHDEHHHEADHPGDHHDDHPADHHSLLATSEEHHNDPHAGEHHAEHHDEHPDDHHDEHGGEHHGEHGGDHHDEHGGEHHDEHGGDNSFLAHTTLEVWVDKRKKEDAFYTKPISLGSITTDAEGDVKATLTPPKRLLVDHTFIGRVYIKTEHVTEFVTGAGQQHPH